MTVELQATSSAWICTVYAFGATIFFVLLCIERPVWSVARGRSADGRAEAEPREASGVPPGTAPEPELRRVHATLRSLIPLLPPANGIVVGGGTALLLAQAWLRDGDWRSVLIAGLYVAILLWTILGLRIARSVRDTFATPSDALLRAIEGGVARLIRAHRDGLVNTLGPLALQLALIVHR